MAIGRFWRRRPGFGRWGDLQESGGGGAGSGRWRLPAGSAWQPSSSSAPSTPRAGPAAAPLPPSSPRAGPAAAVQMDSTACSAMKGSTLGHESPLLDMDSGEAATRAAPWVLVQRKRDEAEVRGEQQEE